MTAIHNRDRFRTYTLVGPDGKPYQSQTPGTLGGNRRAKLYGRFDCRAAVGAIAKGGYVKYRVFFADEQTAIAAGYRPCAVCLPEKYKAWKADQAGYLKARPGVREPIAPDRLR